MILEDLCKYFISHRSVWYACKVLQATQLRKLLQVAQFFLLFKLLMSCKFSLFLHVSEILRTLCFAYTGR